MSISNLTKKCGSCGEEKPLSGYYKRADRAKKSARSVCKKCFSKSTMIDASVRRSRRKDVLFRMMSQRGCVICGENNPLVLDWHHVEPSEKDNNISSGYHKGIGWLKSEVDKCDVLCVLHHRIIHWQMASDTKGDYYLSRFILSMVEEIFKETACP